MSGSTQTPPRGDRRLTDVGYMACMLPGGMGTAALDELLRQSLAF